MSDDVLKTSINGLRDRIAAVLIAHPDRQDGKCCRPDVDEWHTTVEEWAAHVADAVIAELGLRREGGTPNRVAIAMQRRRPNTHDYRYRYVTDWTADVE